MRTASAALVVLFFLFALACGRGDSSSASLPHPVDAELSYIDGHQANYLTVAFKFPEDIAPEDLTAAIVDDKTGDVAIELDREPNRSLCHDRNLAAEWHVFRATFRDDLSTPIEWASRTFRLRDSDGRMVTVNDVELTCGGIE